MSDDIVAVFQKEMSLLDGPPAFAAHDDLGSDAQPSRSSSSGYGATAASWKLGKQ